MLQSNFPKRHHCVKQYFGSIITITTQSTVFLISATLTGRYNVHYVIAYYTLTTSLAVFSCVFFISSFHTNIAHCVIIICYGAIFMCLINSLHTYIAHHAVTSVVDFSFSAMHTEAAHTSLSSPFFGTEHFNLCLILTLQRNMLYKLSGTCRQYVPLEQKFMSTKLHGVLFHNTIIL